MYDRIDIDGDIPHQFFTLKDLLYSGILMGREGLQSDLRPLSTRPGRVTVAESEVGVQRCNLLEGNYHFTTQDTENCRWSYNCMQHQDQFPSFYLNANLETSTGNCTQVVAKNKRFVRTTCQSDSSLPHWLECECQDIVVGYKYKHLAQQ
jgi:hypothetical protein